MRVKQALSQASGGLVGVEQALRKHGANGGVTINFDQFLVALSRVDASLTLDDIKEFFALVGGSRHSKGRDATQFGDSVQIAEMLQILSL